MSSGNGKKVLPSDILFLPAVFAKRHQRKVLAKATALRKSKRWADAIQQYQSLIDTSDNKRITQKAWLGLAFCTSKLRKWAQANEAFDHAARLGRLPAKGYFIQGNCLLKTKETDKGVAALADAVRSAPQNEKYAARLMSTLSRLGETARLESILEKLVERDNKNPFLWARLSQAARLNGNLPKAEQACKSGLTLDDKNAALHAALAAIYALQDKLEQAVQSYEKAIRLSPEVPAWHVALADVQHRLHPERNLRPDLWQTYATDYSGKTCDVLYLVFSPMEGRYVLGNYPFQGDRLLIKETRISYYTYNLDGLVDYLRRLIVDNGYTKICLVGTSKGSYGALATAARLAPLVPDAHFFIAAFSPQTQLWPKNENIDNLPTYRLLLNEAKSSITSKVDLRKNGSLSLLMKGNYTNLSGKVIYGELHQRDTHEAMRLANVPFLELLPVKGYPLHTTIALYTKKGDSLVRAITFKYAKATDDAFFMPENAEQLAQDFLKTLKPEEFRLEKILPAWLQR